MYKIMRQFFSILSRSPKFVCSAGFGENIMTEHTLLRDNVQKGGSRFNQAPKYAVQTVLKAFNGIFQSFQTFMCGLHLRNISTFSWKGAQSCIDTLQFIGILWVVFTRYHPLMHQFCHRNHLIAFDFVTGPAKTDKRDWKIDMFITVTSLSTLITSASWSSWFKSGDVPNLLSICFKDVINFLTFFFIFFVKILYTATLPSILESPFHLRRAEWRAWTFSLICSMVSLVMPQISKILIDPSKQLFHAFLTLMMRNHFLGWYHVEKIIQSNV